MRNMNSYTEDIGLQELTEDIIEKLAEECETEISRFILERIPRKSISEMSVSCILDLTTQLDLEISIDITQSYDTGHPIEAIVEEASEYGEKWIKKRLMEMKGI